MGNLIWWVLGGAAVLGGGAYLYSRSQGKMVEKKDVCIADLPMGKLTLTNSAIASKNAVLLLSYAVQADASGWTCAAKQMRAEAAAITKSLPGGGGGGPGDGGIFERSKPAADFSFLYAGDSKADLEEKIAVAINDLPDEPAGGGLRTDVLHAISAAGTRDEACSLADWLEGIGTYPLVAKRVRSVCDAFEADAAAAATKASLSIDGLPEPTRSNVKYSLTKISHDVYGWSHGAADIWKGLKDAGYNAAAAEYTNYFLPSYEGEMSGTPSIGI